MRVAGDTAPWLYSCVMATHLLVGNPTAQSGKNRERLDRALALMNDAGVAADLLPTLPGGNEELLEDLGLEHSKTLRARAMDLEIFAPEGGAPLATQLDGEEWPASRQVHIEVAPRSIRLIVPAT